MKTRIIPTIAALLCVAASPLVAQSQGDWVLGFGATLVSPKSGNGTLAGGEADISDDTQLGVTAEYFIADNIGIELLAATPFSHDISIAGIGNAGRTKHLPPTLSINYHLPTNGNWTPYAGIGLNYTTFFEERSPLGTLELDDSFGIAVQAGVDYAISNRGALRLNLRWIDIDSDVSLNGTEIGEAEIDPVVVTVGYIHRF